MNGYRRDDDPVFCRECKKLIIFRRTARGKLIPCESNAVWFLDDPQGNKQLLTETGELVRGRIVERGEFDAAQYGYEPHFGNCAGLHMTAEGRKRQEAYARQGGMGLNSPGTAFAPKAPEKAPPPPEAPKFEQSSLFPELGRRRGYHPE